MSSRANVHGVKVGYERLSSPGYLPTKLREFIDGELGKDGLGEYLRTLKDRMADEYVGDDGYRYRPEIIHMSDVNECLLSSYLERKHPDWIQQFPKEEWSKNRRLKTGAATSAWITSLFRTSEKDVSHPLPGVNASLTGRIDFVDEGICYELKTSSDYATSKMRKEGPWVPHIEQVLFYSHCRRYPEARLLYLSHSKGFDIYRIGLENRQKVVNNLVERAKKLHEHLKSNNPPKPEPNYGWSCSICDFSEETCGSKGLCVKEDEGRKIIEETDER